MTITDCLAEVAALIREAEMRGDVAEVIRLFRHLAQTCTTTANTLASLDGL